MRKLLLNKNELTKIRSRLKEKGTTIIPVQLFFNERGIAKLEIAVAKGKKTFDKREDIKKKDVAREMSRIDP
jgi:SsrA-binding protein